MEKSPIVSTAPIADLVRFNYPHPTKRTEGQITPHTSSEFEGWVARAADMFASNPERWITGEPLQNRVVSVRGY